MAKLEHRRFVPTPQDKLEGAVPMNKAEVIEQLARYKEQNPLKYETKKAELFARYGLTLDQEIVPVEDASDVELKALKAKEAKNK